MFERLTASAPVQRTPLRSVAVAFTFHAVVLVGVVQAKRIAPVRSPHPVADTSAIYIPPIAPAQGTSGVGGAVPGTDLPIDVAMPLDALPGVDVPPVILPSTGAPPLDLRRLMGTGVEQPTGGPSTTAATPRSASEVDVPVEVADLPVPAYPPALQAAGIEGRVVVRYVVDTLGMVEGPSIEVVAGDRAEFVAAVRVVLGRARFRPAQVAGLPVRQLVQQLFAFKAQRVR